MDSHLYKAYYDDAGKNQDVQLLSATSVTLICIIYFAFVDDTNLHVTGECHSTGKSIAPSFQAALDR